MNALKVSDDEIVLTRTFPASPQVVFDALTLAEHLPRWMRSTGMTLVACEVDPRPGGAFRWVFQRLNGRQLEVRGVYHSFDRPRSFGYTETYDFSPLEVRVTTELAEVESGTALRQQLRYRSKQERDDDFDGVASSAAEGYGNLERYLSETSG
jgi:uncharacterized protein YndB with AHSA1/START domain